MINDKKKIIINFGGRRIKTRRDALLCNLRKGNRGYKGGEERKKSKREKKKPGGKTTHTSQNQSLRKSEEGARILKYERPRRARPPSAASPIRRAIPDCSSSGHLAAADWLPDDAFYGCALLIG